jgi:membrane protein YdbS with pleckstrin-like domain
MYCPKCGKEVPDEAMFCPYCGYKLKEDVKKSSAQKSEKKLVLRPVFVPWVTLVSVIPVQIFFTIWGGIFFGGFSIPLFHFLFHKDPGFAPFIIFALLFFFGLPVLVYFVKKKTYEKTTYTFYNDHLEYYEGFWTLEKKSINYSLITEISLRRGIIQKRYGLGSIVLSTPATGYSRGRARSGIVIMDIPKSEYIYKVLKNIIGK